MQHWGLCASRVKPLINKYATSCMFADQTIYVNELCLTYVSESERNTYSFDAHAIEHVENILCCNISRWALSVWATSQASYCRIDHRDPHLHTQTHSAPLLRYCPGTAVLLGCSALFHLCFLAVGEKLWPHVSEKEWAQLKDSSLILLGGFNHKCDMIMASVIWNYTEHLTYLQFFWLFVFYQHCSFTPQNSLTATKKCRNVTIHWAEDICTLAAKKGSILSWLIDLQRAEEHQE